MPPCRAVHCPGGVETGGAVGRCALRRGTRHGRRGADQTHRTGDRERPDVIEPKKQEPDAMPDARTNHGARTPTRTRGGGAASSPCSMLSQSVLFCSCNSGPAPDIPRPRHSLTLYIFGFFWFIIVCTLPFCVTSSRPLAPAAPRALTPSRRRNSGPLSTRCHVSRAGPRYMEDIAIRRGTS